MAINQSLTKNHIIIIYYLLEFYFIFLKEKIRRNTESIFFFI